MADHPKKIMIVAGEQSGDILGAELIAALQQTYPNARFYGIGGDRMIAKGLQSHYPIDRLSVMGFIEPLKRLPELLRMLFALKKELKSASPPDIFIGIDSPEFNIWLELTAKKHRVYSVHYVSPSVWAWRQGRIKRIKKAVDLMLTLLPFEADFYRRHNVDVAFVGHPLADTLPMHPNRAEARERLKINPKTTLCALMPGSRHSELHFLLPVMVEAAQLLREQYPNIEFLIPAANAARLSEIQQYIQEHGTDYLAVVDGQSHDVMTAANCVVMASGTTTLEAMLLKRRMVICYKWPNLTWRILVRLVKLKWVGLPNLLANAELARELLQDDATAENIASEVSKILEQSSNIDGGSFKDAGDSTHSHDPDQVEAPMSPVMQQFYTIHKELKRDASAAAAKAIAEGWQRHQ